MCARVNLIGPYGLNTARACYALIARGKGLTERVDTSALFSSLRKWPRGGAQQSDSHRQTLRGTDGTAGPEDIDRQRVGRGSEEVTCRRARDPLRSVD
jgi:hypothetical protein